jgi:hypothetical protein
MAAQCTGCGFVSPPVDSRMTPAVNPLAAPGVDRSVCQKCGLPLTIGADAVVRALLPVGRTALSIVAGYLGLTVLLCAPSPLALAVGIWAVIDLKKRPGMHGMGRAVFGIVMGAVGTAVLLVGLVAALAAHR